MTTAPFVVRLFAFPFQAFGWCPNGGRCPLSHDTDLVILQDEKSLRDRRRKRKRQREKKADGGKAAEDASAFDSAPQNKVAHLMEDDRRRPETLQDADGDGGQNEGTSNGGEDQSSLATSDGRAAAAASKTVNTGTHRAGFDAFMTGYVFAYARTMVSKEEAGQQEGAGQQQEEGQQEGAEPWLPACLNKVYLSGKAAPLNVVKSTFSRSSKAHLEKMEMVWGQRL